MPIFKRNPFGHILFLKRWLVRIIGVVSHGRYRRFNQLQIEGSEIIRDLPPTNVLLFPTTKPILPMLPQCTTFLTLR